MGTVRYIKGFVLEPLLGFFIVPIILLLLFPSASFVWIQIFPLNILGTITGIITTGVGVFLIFQTTYHFAKFGDGSAAPWDQPRKLVVHGLYRYVRNPMVLGVLLAVLGETIFFSSIQLLMLLIFLFFGNHLLLIKSEEPELKERFGEEYASYMEHVPRWIPRRKPWNYEE